MRTSFPTLATLALLGFVVAAPSQAATLEKTFDHTYTLSSGKDFHLSNINGDVEIEAWDRSEIRVEARITARGTTSSQAQELLDRTEVRVEETSDLLRIETQRPDRNRSGSLLSWIFGHGDGGIQVSYHLTAPRSLTASIRTLNGKIDTQGVGGEISLASTNGPIHVESAHGSLQARTTNGGIYAELQEVPSGADLHFDTTNGGITVALPESIQTSVKARTTNGSLSSDFPLTAKGQWSSKRLEGALNGGGTGQLSLTTTNGPIRIRSL